MFEKIISITKNYAIVKISNNIGDDILNYNVVLEDKDKKILGEIDEVINDEVKISFLGEFINNRFYVVLFVDQHLMLLLELLIRMN